MFTKPFRVYTCADVFAVIRCYSFCVQCVRETQCLGHWLRLRFNYVWGFFPHNLDGGGYWEYELHHQSFFFL